METAEFELESTILLLLPKVLQKLSHSPSSSKENTSFTQMSQKILVLLIDYMLYI